MATEPTTLEAPRQPSTTTPDLPLGPIAQDSLDLHAYEPMDASLTPIVRRIAEGERIGFDDALTLYRSPDIFTLGRLAQTVRHRLHGREVYYNVNRHINYTNLCVLRCKFCAFYRNWSKRQEFDDTYELSVDDIVQRATTAYEEGATEVHIVGGLHPKLPLEWYEDMLRSLRSACPKLHLKAFTAIEILHFCKLARPKLTIAEVLTRLRNAGLDSLPGGGAEIFDDRVHDEGFKNKPGETGWFDVHRNAHALGIPSNVTMLYGHIETQEQRIRHLVKVRDHQDASLAAKQQDPAKAAFNACIPLSFIPDGSEFEAEGVEGPTALTDLKTLAISRVVLDNIPHIKAFWIMQTPKLAQVALAWGCNDLDGTVQWYDITKREGTANDPNKQELAETRLRRLIVETGYEPVERDSIYRRILRGDGGRTDWEVESTAKPPR